MTEEMTEITIVNPRQARPPSMWMNLFSLIVLFGVILGMRYLSTRWTVQTPPPESQENQIVLEDLENEKPIVESAAIEMPQENRTTDQKPKNRKQKLRIAKQKPHGTQHAARSTSPYTQPDPYTNGSPQDLDLPENQPTKGGLQKVRTTQSQATATKPASHLDERDLFIPFESD